MIKCLDCGITIQVRSFEKHKLSQNHLFYNKLKRKQPDIASTADDFEETPVVQVGVCLHVCMHA